MCSMCRMLASVGHGMMVMLPWWPWHRTLGSFGHVSRTGCNPLAEQPQDHTSRQAGNQWNILRRRFISKECTQQSKFSEKMLHAIPLQCSAKLFIAILLKSLHEAHNVETSKVQKQRSWTRSPKDISLQGDVSSYLFLLFLLPFLFELRIVAPHRTPCWLRPIASGAWCALEVRLRWSTVALLMSSHQMTGGWSTKQTRVKFACNRWGLFQTTNFIQSLSDLSSLLACFCSRSYLCKKVGGQYCDPAWSTCSAAGFGGSLDSMSSLHPGWLQMLGRIRKNDRSGVSGCACEWSCVQQQLWSISTLGFLSII
jgi:hypothetical protein